MKIERYEYCDTVEEVLEAMPSAVSLSRVILTTVDEFMNYPNFDAIPSTFKEYAHESMYSASIYLDKVIEELGLPFVKAVDLVEILQQVWETFTEIKDQIKMFEFVLEAIAYDTSDVWIGCGPGGRGVSTSCEEAGHGNIYAQYPDHEYVVYFIDEDLYSGASEVVEVIEELEEEGWDFAPSQDRVFAVYDEAEYDDY